MNKLTEYLKTNALIIGLIGLLIFGGLRYCSNDKALNQRIGAMQESVLRTTAEVTKLQIINAEIKEQNKKILQVNAILKEESIATNVAMKEGLVRIKQLQANRPEAPPECQPIIIAMQVEIDEWKNQFNLAITDRDNWQQQANNFEMAYKNEVTVSTNLQISYDLVLSDSFKKSEIIKDLQKSFSFKSLESTALIIVIVVVGGYLVYRISSK